MPRCSKLTGGRFDAQMRTSLRSRRSEHEAPCHAARAMHVRRPMRSTAATARVAREALPPSPASPMLATLIDAPFDDDAWLFEIKWDGFRAIADIDADGTVTLT